MVEIVSKERIIEAVKEAKEKAKKRNFEQSYDLMVALRDIDLKKPENRKRGIIFLPKGRGKPARVAVILPRKFESEMKGVADELLFEEDLPNVSKREAKKFARRNDFILAYADSVPKVARFLGRYLGPRGKMPDPKYGMIFRDFEQGRQMVEKFKKQATRFQMKDSPTINILVGSESMPVEDVAENISYVLERLVEILPQGRQNIKNVYVKLTMGPTVKIL